MPDETHGSEEEGFKFVDKRRTADVLDSAEAASDSEVAVGSDPPLSEESEVIHPEDDNDEAGLPGLEGAFGIASYAIGLLSMNAWQYLGLVADPKTGKATRDLTQARIAIDCVGGIVDGLEKNRLSIDPRTLNDIKRVLNDLRLNFVTQTNMSKEAVGGNVDQTA